MLPILQLQTFSKIKSGLVSANFCKQKYKITVSQGSIQLFLSFILVILTWCLALVIFSGWTRVPRTSSFPEVDLISKIRGASDNDGIWDRIDRTVEKQPRNLARALHGIRMQVTNNITQFSENEEIYGFQTREI